MDADPEPGRPERVDLGLGEEVAGVDEAHRDRLAGVLGRGGPAHGEERAVLVAGGTAQAADRLPAGHEGPVMHVALARPGAAQRHELPVGVREVEDGRQRGGDRQGRGAVVGERQRPGDDRAVSEQRRADGDAQPGGLVDEVDLQRLSLVAGLRVRRREARQLGLAGDDAVRRVAQVEHRRPVRARDDQRRDPEVPDAGHRDLEPHRLGDPVGEALEGVRPQVSPRRPCSQRGPRVEVPEPAVLEHPHRPARAAVRQVPLAGAWVPVDRHPPAPSARSVHAQR